MRARSFFLVASLLAAVSLSAQETYRFRISLATIAEASQALTPDKPVNIDPADERHHRQVLLFVKHQPERGWRTTFIGCKETPFDCEVMVTSSTSSSRERYVKLAPVAEQRHDLAFGLNLDSTVRAQCLRAACGIRYTRAGDDAWQDATLAFGETRDVPIPGDVEITLPR